MSFTPAVLRQFTRVPYQTCDRQPFTSPIAAETSAPNPFRSFLARHQACAVVSNRSPHFVQIHRLTTNSSPTNSDQSGAISASPHLTHFIVMAIRSGHSLLFQGQ